MEKWISGLPSKYGLPFLSLKTFGASSPNNFKKEVFFEADETERENVNVKF